MKKYNCMCKPVGTGHFTHGSLSFCRRGALAYMNQTTSVQIVSQVGNLKKKSLLKQLCIKMLMPGEAALIIIPVIIVMSCVSVKAHRAIFRLMLPHCFFFILLSLTSAVYINSEEAPPSGRNTWIQIHHLCPHKIFLLNVFI